MLERISTEPYIEETEIEGLLIVRRPRYKDPRGSFQELVRFPDLESRLGRKIDIVQTQISFSDPNVLRGIHAEDQTKIITPLSGKILSVVVDLRPGSKTFGKYKTIKIDNRSNYPELTTLCLTPGLGNAFYTYPDSSMVMYVYSVTSLYNPNNVGRGVKFDDKTLEIPWPNPDPVISEKDRNLPNLQDFIKDYYG